MNFATMLLAAAGSHGSFSFHHQLLVASTVIVVTVLILLGVLARGQIGIVPRGFGAAFEHVFDWIDGLSQDMIGPGSRQYVPILMSFFLFILASNWSGLLPLPVFNVDSAYASQLSAHSNEGHAQPDLATVIEGETPVESEDHHLHFAYEAPTVSFNTTLALAVISFLAFNFYGIKKNVMPSAGGHHHDHEGDEHHTHSSGGIGGIFTWLGHFIQPTPMLWNSLEGVARYALVPLLLVLFLCLNIVEEVARILSLSIRLFGNISGEHSVKVNLLGVLGKFLNQSLSALKVGGIGSGVFHFGLAGLIWGASVFATLLGALAGFIQAMVFMILSLVYIAHAVADEH